VVQDQLSIRSGAPGDVESIAALHIQARASLHSIAPAGFGTALAEPPALTEVAGEFSEALGDEDAVLLVAEVGGTLAGFLLGAIERHGDDLVEAPFLTVQYLAVKESQRGKRVGAALLVELEKVAREKRIATVDLLVWERNDAAVALYERAGYVTLERRLVKRIDLDIA
jgi:ribosomal protein S18 acetylase RimI-like enzyme